MGGAVQVEPFQNRLHVAGGVVPVFTFPIAMQVDGLLHDKSYTPRRELPLGAESVVAVQVEPFHCSMRASGAVRAKPTVTQNEVLTHDTPERSLSSVETVLGLGTMDQADPFHCSTSV